MSEETLVHVYYRQLTGPYKLEANLGLVVVKRGKKRG